jgi:hypothetical protein
MVLARQAPPIPPRTCASTDPKARLEVADARLRLRQPDVEMLMAV